jgi:acetyl/propionyl-CoA carboxylase alpha subunit
MSLFFVTIGKNEYRVNLNGAQAMVDGELVSGNLQRLNNSGLHLLCRGMQAQELFLNSQNGEMLEVLMGSRRVLAKVETLQRHLSHHKVFTQSGVLLAPMSGLVVNVLVSKGQQIEQGQTLVVLESMKMQMQLRAENTGVVRGINVKVGDQVKKGVLLIQIDAAVA